MKFKPSIAPWHVVHIGHMKMIGDCQYVIVSASGEIVALTDANVPEYEENVRLMSASPDMIEALNFVKKRLHECTTIGLSLGLKGISLVVNAIKKAEEVKLVKTSGAEIHAPDGQIKDAAQDPRMPGGYLDNALKALHIAIRNGATSEDIAKAIQYAYASPGIDALDDTIDELLRTQCAALRLKKSIVRSIEHHDPTTSIAQAIADGYAGAKHHHLHELIDALDVLDLCEPQETHIDAENQT